jgi:hypothetical protein
MRLLVYAAAILALSACGEPPYRHYATAAEAIAAGERDGGWLPGWLPSSAQDVHLQSDVDNDRWWLRAKLSKPAADSLRAVLSPVAVESVRVLYPRGRGWWFEGLIEQEPWSDAGLHAELFRGTGAPVPRTTIVAFDRMSPDIYAWTTVGR